MSDPDIKGGLRLAADLARAQGTEGGDDHDRLLRDASYVLKQYHDAVRPLLARAEKAEKERGEAEATDERQEFADLFAADERLSWMLRVLGDEFGPLGVAVAAAQLTDPEVLFERLTREEVSGAVPTVLVAEGPDRAP